MNRLLQTFSLRLCVAMLTYFLLYRAALFAKLALVDIKPFFFTISPEDIGPLLMAVFRDLAFTMAICTIVWPLNYLERDNSRKIATISSSVTMLVVLGIVTAVHFKVIFAMHSGLTVALLLEGVTSLGVAEFLSSGSVLDWVLLGSPLILYIGLGRIERSSQQTLLRAVLVGYVVIGASGAFTRYVLGGAHRVKIRELFRSPVVFLIKDYQSRTVNKFLTAGKLPGREQMASLNFVDPIFTRAGGQSGLASRRRPSKQWNLITFVLESTGFDYIHHQVGSKRVMPFLTDLMKKSLVLTRHFATGNTSPRSIFSIFSGIYPTPREKMFCSGSRVFIPSLTKFLGSNYDHLLITPGRVDSYFPKAFMQNSGLSKMIDYYNLPIDTFRESLPNGRNELDYIEYLLGKLKSPRQPFHYTYYSFAPHYDYMDYGPQYRIYDNYGDPLKRYYNNLYMLDMQLRRVFEQLKRSNLLNSTILVFVGDHGEAFGQHSGNYTHSRQSFNENFHSPAIFYQPELFKPAVIEEFTSHVDILPTILDAMSIEYDIKQMQGESLLSGKPKRKYIFMFGNENTLSSISAKGIKLQISVSQQNCSAYDLQSDWAETRPLNCNDFPEQYQATLAYYRYQPEILASSNAKVQPHFD